MANGVDQGTPTVSGPVGILYSRIGYDLGKPIRVIVRGPEGTIPADAATFTLYRKQDSETVPILTGPVTYWGAIWGSHWWVADASAVTDSGEYTLTIVGATDRWETGSFSIAPDLLWDRTRLYVGVEQAERRRIVARNRLGWYDAGMEWQEANSHVGYLTGFFDLLEFAADRIPGDEKQRVIDQIINGLDYLAALQDRAANLPNGAGGVVHQIWRFDELILPGDVSKAALAWARAIRLLPDQYAEKRTEYRVRALNAMRYLHETAKPMGENGFSRINHGAPDDFIVPDEWMTRDLLVHLWAAFELTEAGEPGFRDEAIRLAGEIINRQIASTDARDGFYGHFRTFASAEITEKAWIHNHTGSDCGGFFPHYILPLLQMSERWPDAPDAAHWRQSVQDFAYGYFLPACRANPFYLLPLGQFDNQGLIWFAGSWHGMNGAYGFAATLATEFARAFHDPEFDQIAVGNLQWIAGLNAGLTAESLFGSHLWSTTVEPGLARPVSMINGIGSAYAGTWLNLRGAICNGFSTGNQFRFDVVATRENDSPSSFTDEDWITHAGAWLAAIARSST